MLERIADRRVRGQIVERAEKLSDEPEKQGKALLGELSGLRSLRASGQRYRIIYRVERSRVLVLIVVAGSGSREAAVTSTSLRESCFALGWLVS